MESEIGVARNCVLEFADSSRKVSRNRRERSCALSRSIWRGARKSSRATARGGSGAMVAGVIRTRSQKGWRKRKHKERKFTAET